MHSIFEANLFSKLLFRISPRLLLAALASSTEPYLNDSVFQSDLILLHLNVFQCYPQTFVLSKSLKAFLVFPQSRVLLMIPKFPVLQVIVSYQSSLWHELSPYCLLFYYYLKLLIAVTDYQKEEHSKFTNFYYYYYYFKKILAHFCVCNTCHYCTLLKIKLSLKAPNSFVSLRHICKYWCSQTKKI